MIILHLFLKLNSKYQNSKFNYYLNLSCQQIIFKYIKLVFIL